MRSSSRAGPIVAWLLREGRRSHSRSTTLCACHRVRSDTILVKQVGLSHDEALSAVPSDTLGWLAAQLDGPGDAVIAALTIAGQFLLTLPIAKEEGTHPAWSVASSASDTRLSEIMRKIPVVTPPHTMPLEVA
jgi:hypothetical protein